MGSLCTLVAIFLNKEHHEVIICKNLYCMMQIWNDSNKSQMVYKEYRRWMSNARILIERTELSSFKLLMQLLCPTWNYSGSLIWIELFKHFDKKQKVLRKFGYWIVFLSLVIMCSWFKRSLNELIHQFFHINSFFCKNSRLFIFQVFSEQQSHRALLHCATGPTK